MTEGPLIYAVDHCFGIRGQGTIMTGTILSGKISLNDVSSIPMYIHNTYVYVLPYAYNHKSNGHKLFT